MSTLIQPARLSRKDAAVRQITRNLASRPGIVGSLLALQLAGMLFSISSSDDSSNAFGNLNIHIQNFNSDIIIVLTLAWAFLAPLYLTGRDSFESDMVFANDRLTRHFGNIGYLALIVLAGSLTAVLACLTVLLIPLLGSREVLLPEFGPWGLSGHALIMFTVLLSYALLAAGLGYLIGTLLGLSRLLVIGLFLLGLIFLGVLDDTGWHLLGRFAHFLFGNEQAALLLIKAAGASAILFAIAVISSNRQEAGA
ncbi:hypothetical protein [Edaphobacillus lindanitolerans]|uniref:ABC-2 type transport system permease protein n=1 Tax=Edaphobacillus lindanitolerans TaxID=550447 RepID=A0A1U7PM23_9BACI|nr:hypothetical protein [Edaphobacillus lindanitolerans]SIT70427.1 hypothetical protein SAMN05428946_0606 [Edaphobacillus lindanitolerans]